MTLLALVAPRLCLSALKLSQPLLINRVTSWLSGADSQGNPDVGRGLIGATVCKSNCWLPAQARWSQ